ncbi:MAG: hypothetical protein R3A80_07190 [Bdellovibrionota bacterium]
MNQSLALAFLFVLLCPTAGAEDHKWGTFAYDIEIETGLEIPAQSDIDQVIIWTHLPTRRQWTIGEGAYNSVSKLTRQSNLPYSLESKEQNHGDDQSFALKIPIKREPNNLTTIKTKVSYRVISKDRDFKWPPEVDWSKFAPLEASKDQEVNEIAKRLRSSTKNPGEALVQLSKELKKD